MDKDLEHMTNEVVYKAMLEQQPELVNAIAALLDNGQTPKEIEGIMREKFGNVQMVRNVGHVAAWLQFVEHYLAARR